MSGYNTLSDNELITFLREGSHSAYVEIYRRYHYLLIVHAYKKLRDQDQAKDVVQELFISLWIKKGYSTFSGTLSAYLYTAVRYKIIDRIKHQDVEKKYLDSLQDFQQHSGVIADHLIREKQLSEIIESEINKLPTRVRETFLLSRREHLTHEQISQELGITKQSVRSYTKDALKILRLRLSHLLS